MTQQLLAQGAEAKILLNKDKNTIIKDRIKKSYRHQTLDEQLRKSRTKKEAKILNKALSIKANVPKVLNTDKFNLEIEFIQGDRLSETLNSYNEKKQFEIIQKIGEQTALLHNNNIIHGDLTTSNVIIKQNKQTNQAEQVNTKKEIATKETPFKVFIIDFGLGFISSKIEDKAVDLHLIKQALEAKHFQNHEDLFKNFLKGYKLKHQDSDKVLERLEKVEKRGRYKH